MTMNLEHFITRIYFAIASITFYLKTYVFLTNVSYYRILDYCSSLTICICIYGYKIFSDKKNC